jgi:hypothetical protein
MTPLAIRRSHWSTSSTTCTSKCSTMSRKDGKKQLSNKQTSQGYIVSRKGGQLGQWSYYKAFDKIFPTLWAWMACLWAGCIKCLTRTWRICWTITCMSWLFNPISLPFLTCFFWKYKQIWLGSKAQEMIFFIMCKNVQCISLKYVDPPGWCHHYKFGITLVYSMSFLTLRVYFSPKRYSDKFYCHKCSIRHASHPTNVE